MVDRQSNKPTALQASIHRLCLWCSLNSYSSDSGTVYLSCCAILTETKIKIKKCVGLWCLCMHLDEHTIHVMLLHISEYTPIHPNLHNIYLASSYIIVLSVCFSSSVIIHMLDLKRKESWMDMNRDERWTRCWVWKKKTRLSRNVSNWKEGWSGNWD